MLITTLNEQLSGLFEKLEVEYSQNHIFQDKGLGNVYEVPVFNGGGYTPYPKNNKGAFTLNTGTTITHELIGADSSKHLAGIKRLAFSYEYCVRLSDNEVERIQLFEVILRKAIEDFLKNDLGINKDDLTLGISRISFKMPGRMPVKEFFLELQNAAGYELRLWADCVKI